MSGAALRYVRTSNERAGSREVVSERSVKRLLSPAELRLLDVRPVTTILSTYKAERPRYRYGDKAVTKKQNDALLIVNAHLLRRFEVSLPTTLDAKALTWLNEQLVLWLPGWLDELSNTLLGEAKVSSKKDTATGRCLAAIEKTTGIKFPEPFITTTEGLTTMETKVASAPVAKKVSPVVKKAAAALAAADPQAAKKAGVAAPAKAAPAKKTAPKKAPPPIKPNLGKAPKGADKKDAGDGSHVIKVLVDENPKREGSASHKRFALYGGKAGKVTVAKFLEKGGTRGDLRYDTGHGYVKVVKA